MDGPGARGGQLFPRRDKLFFYFALAHVPAIFTVSLLYGKGFVHSLADSAPIGVAAYAAYYFLVGTRNFRVAIALLLAACSAMLIHGSNGQLEMHFDVFLNLTVLIMYYDYLPIAVMVVAVALHHAIGNVLFPYSVFSGGPSWPLVIWHAFFVVLQSTAAVIVAERVKRASVGVHKLADAMAESRHPLQTAIDALAQGDLTQHLVELDVPPTVEARDEIGAISESFAGMQRDARHTSIAFERALRQLELAIGAVAVAADELAGPNSSAQAQTSGSSAAIEAISQNLAVVAQSARSQATEIRAVDDATTELTSTASQIARGTADQAASLQTVVHAIRTLDEQIAAVAKSSEDLAGSARSANTAAEMGARASLQTEAAVTRLREDALATERAIAVLETRSAAVSDIVSTIQELADQTNLLALNAAIEAARAGEQGRGFAVVADEVRKLAERSSRSTGDIDALLEQILAEIVRVAAALRVSTAAMESDLKVVDTVKESLAEIGATVASTQATADYVAAAAKSMREASVNVSQEVASTSKHVEENAAAAEELHAAANSLRKTVSAVAEASAAQTTKALEASDTASKLAEQVAVIAMSTKAGFTGAERLLEIMGRFKISAKNSRAVQPPAPADRTTVVR